MKCIKSSYTYFVLLYALYNFSAKILFQCEVTILCTSFILFHDKRILKSKNEFLDVKICQFEKSACFEF